MTDESAEQARRRKVGAYAKLLANYASDDSIIAAGESAELLFVRGLAFCATSDSDGYITDAQVSRYVGAGMKDAARRAVKLVQVGLWARVDGGYIVRSWTKIHETTAEKGRKLKADRERKRIPKDVASDSKSDSVRIPDGGPTDRVPDSLSLIQSTTEQEQSITNVDSSLEGKRTETLRAVDATKPPTCSKHPDGDSPTPCPGCAKVREYGDKADARADARAKADAAELANDCAACEGTHFVLDADKRPTKRRCDHRSTVAS